MPIIAIQPESNTSTNWTGLPNNSANGQWSNLDEGFLTADNDTSFSNFSSLSGNILTLNFEDPTLPTDRKVLFIRMLIKWRPTTLSLTSLRAKLSQGNPLITIFDETMFINASTTYFEFSCGFGACQSPPSESNRFAPTGGWTEAEVADLVVEFFGLDENLRITAVELELGTGFIETGSGGCDLGGVADLGPERVARAKVKVGGAVNNSWYDQPSGGVRVLSGSNIKDFNDSTPQIGGGMLMGGIGIDALFARKGFLRKTFDISKDLIFTYSGGELNDTPSASLGGESSPIFIEPGINNLFDDIAPATVIDGQVDYRCFYIFNQHVEETIYNIRSWINFETAKGADVKLGIDAKDELQSIVLDTVPDSGYFTVRYEPSNPFGFVPVKVLRPSGLSGDALLAAFAVNFQTALRINPDLKDVIVNASTFGSGISFEILFEKLDGKRQQENLLIVENTLSPATTILIKKVVKGSPINSTAAEINIDVTPPGGVNFSVPNSDFPFVIPKLREGEGFHLWVERTVSPTDTAIANDGFGLGISIEPVEPVEVG